MPRSVGSPLQHTTINRFRLGTGWLDLKKKVIVCLTPAQSMIRMMGAFMLR
jgi:hypothetical protein